MRRFTCPRGCILDWQIPANQAGKKRPPVWPGGILLISLLSLLQTPNPLSLDRLQVIFARAGEIAQHDPRVFADLAPVRLIGGLDVEEDLAEGETVPEADADVKLDEDHAPIFDVTGDPLVVLLVDEA